MAVTTARTTWRRPMPTNPDHPIRQIVDALRERQRFVISSHARPDGDSIGSQLALAHTLTGLGKTVRIVNHDAPPDALQTIPGASAIEVADTVDGAHDAAVVLECSSLDRTEVTGLDRQLVINIDHHAGNGMYGTLNWFDPSACACAEMVHDLVAELGVAVTPQIGIALYAGILTDTGSFRHANITSRTFEICRRVAAAGVDVAGVAAEMYQRSSVGKLRLTGALLTDMTLDADGRVAVLHVDDALLRQTGCPTDDLDGLINLPLSATDVQAVIMFKFLDGSARVSLRSKGTIDVRAVAASFGGGGHRNASGFSLDGPREHIVSRAVAAVIGALDTAPDEPAR